MRLIISFTLVFSAFYLTSAAAQTTLVSQDVLSEARSLGPKRAMAYCPANPNYWRGSLSSILNKRPPDRLLGLNSRMDNAQRLPAHVALEDATNVMSAAAAHVLVTGNARVADQLLDVLTLWARSGAYLNTKVCTKNQRWTGQCTEWTRSDGQDLSDAKDHSTTVMAMASIASSYNGSVANYQRQQRASDHKAIQDWLNTSPPTCLKSFAKNWKWPANCCLHLIGRRSFREP